jgi:haloalkane dehalogenase
MDTPFFTGRQTMPPVWFQFRDMLEADTDPSISALVQAGCGKQLPPEILAAYDAPFPNAESKAGARAFPIRVLPLSADLPAAKAGWRVLKTMRKFDTRPTLMLWGENDVMFPLELGNWCAGALCRELPVPIEGASHFVLEDSREEVERRILDWLGSS